jgi:predicted peptidase
MIDFPSLSLPVILKSRETVVMQITSRCGLIGLLLLGITPALHAEAPASLYSSETVTVKSLANRSYAYRLLSPPAEASGKTFPLVVFLHGSGERGTDNSAQLKSLPSQMASPKARQAFPCFLLAPQCEPNKQWVDVPWGDKQSKPLPAQPSEMMQCAIAALEQVRSRKEIDPTRVYLTGLSMGGYGTWDLAMRHPDWFAAVVPICGGGDETKVSVLKDVPLWAFHGTADTIVWPERTQRLIDALTAAGGKPKLSLLQNVGHNSWSPAYEPSSGLLTWMFAQKRPAKP